MGRWLVVAAAICVCSIGIDADERQSASASSAIRPESEAAPKSHTTLRFDEDGIDAVQALHAARARGLRVVRMACSFPEFSAVYVFKEDEDAFHALDAFNRDIAALYVTLAKSGVVRDERMPRSSSGIRLNEMTLAAAGDVAEVVASELGGYVREKWERFSPQTPREVVSPSAEGQVAAAASSQTFVPDTGWIGYNHVTKRLESYFSWKDVSWTIAERIVGYEHDFNIDEGDRDAFVKAGAGTYASNLPNWYPDDPFKDDYTILSILSYPATVSKDVTYFTSIPVTVVNPALNPKRGYLGPNLVSWALPSEVILWGYCIANRKYPPSCVNGREWFNELRYYRDRSPSTPLFSEFFFDVTTSWGYSWDRAFGFAAKTCPLGMYRGEYFNDKDLDNNVPNLRARYVRCDGSINFAWGTQSPGLGIRNDQFGIRWTAQPEFNAGTHNVFVRSDDGVRVWLDGAVVIDEWHESGTTGTNVSRTLSEGAHALKVEYYENGGDAKVQLQIQQAPPTAPATVVASSPASGQMLARWTDASTDETYFVIEVKPPNAPWDEVKTLPKNSTSTTIAGLTPGALYNVRLRACNNGGCSKYSNEAGVTIVGTLPATCYTLNAFGSPTSGGYPTIGTSFNCNNAGYVNGTQISIAAAAYSGYQFANWAASNCSLANANSNATTCTVTGGGSITVTANFTAVPNDSGTIAVRALNNGVPWSGGIELHLAGPSNRTITSVPQTFTSLAGTYTLSYVSGGPAGTMVSAITPSSAQGFTPGGTAEFVISFVPRDPAVLVAALNQPTDVAVDATHVYWTEAWGDTGTVKKMPKNGGPVTVLAGNMYSPSALALDGSYVYFREQPGINVAYVARVSKDGGAVTVIASGQPSVWDVALDAGYVYWTDGYAGSVRRAPQTGGGVSILATGLTTPAGIVTDANTVYVSEWDSPGRILSIPAIGGTVTTINSFNRSRDLVFASGYLYWMESVFTNDAKIIKWPIAGGSTVRLATGLDNPRDLTTDGVNVYWIEDRLSGAVKQVPVGGGAVMTSSDAAIYPSAITTDGAFVYWVEYGDGVSGTGKLKRTPVVVTPRPVVSLAASDPNAREAGRDASTFTVTRTGSTAEPLTISYALAGTATSADYESLPGSVTIPAGQSSESIAITPIDDAQLETGESVVLSISSAAGYERGDSAEGTATITDNDSTVTMSTADAAASERGTDSATFIVTRDGPTVEALNVSVSFAGTAVNGVDYEELATTIVIPAGSTSRNIVVKPLNDALPEGGEAVIPTILGNSNYRVGEPSFGTAVIADLLDPPTNVAAAPGQGGVVDVSWNLVTGATSYRVYRSSNAVTYSLIGTANDRSFRDDTTSGNTAYLYKVRAVSSGESIDSASDLATTTTFTDPVITPASTKLKAVHFTELLTAVNAVRRLGGLPDVSFTAPAPVVGTRIRGQHIRELRAALDEARGVLGLGVIPYVDSEIVGGTTTVKAQHLTDIRKAVQ